MPIKTKPKTKSKPDGVMDFDPNLKLCGRSASFTVKFTFGTWKYRCEKIVEVISNCDTISVFECALDSLNDQLREAAEWGEPLLLEGTDGQICRHDYGYGYWHVDDDDFDDVDSEWLKDMLVAAEIIAVKPYKE